MKFEVLYHFSNGLVHLVETKRLDLPSSAGPGEIYQWFFVDDQKVRLLTFGSMSLNPQGRTFVEGAVQFNLSSCTGRIFELDLELTRQEKVSASLRTKLEQSLRVKERAP